MIHSCCCCCFFCSPTWDFVFVIFKEKSALFHSEKIFCKKISLCLQKIYNLLNIHAFLPIQIFHQNITLQLYSLVEVQRTYNVARIFLILNGHGNIFAPGHMKIFEAAWNLPHFWWCLELPQSLMEPFTMWKCTLPPLYFLNAKLITSLLDNAVPGHWNRGWFQDWKQISQFCITQSRIYSALHRNPLMTTWFCYDTHFP